MKTQTNGQKNQAARDACRITGCAKRDVRIKSTALDLRTREHYLTVGQELVMQSTDTTPSGRPRIAYEMQRRRARIHGRKRVLLRLKRVNQ